MTRTVQIQLNFVVGHVLVDRIDLRKTTLLVSPQSNSVVLQHSVAHIVTEPKTVVTQLGSGLFCLSQKISDVQILLADGSVIMMHMSGIVNRTQSNSIHGLGSIEFSNRTKSNTELCVSSISKPIRLNRTNQTQSNSIH